VKTLIFVYGGTQCKTDLTYYGGDMHNNVVVAVRQILVEKVAAFSCQDYWQLTLSI